jgi:ATP synthase protein I
MNADDERDAVGQGKGGAPAGGDFDERLKRLRSSLDAQKGRSAGRPGLADNRGMAMALRLGSELVAGVIVGFVIGYGIDHFLGTTPWGMIVFLFLGFAAGTLNVMRSAGLVAPARFDEPRRRDRDGGGT